MNLKKLKEEGAALLSEIKAIDETCKAEKRKLTTDEETKWEQLYKDLDAKKSEIRLEEKRATLENFASDFVDIESNERELSKDEYREGAGRAIHKLITGGKAILTKEDYRFLDENPYKEFRAQTKGTTTEGGFMVPEGFSNMLAKAELFYGNVEALADVFTTTTGNDIPWPANDDTANVASQVNEAGSVASDTDLAFSSQTFKAYKWKSGVVKYTSELAQDSFFNIEQMLIEAFAQRFGRGLNAAFTTGAGTTTIEGFITGATLGKTTAGASAVTTDEILDLIYSVDKVYRKNGTVTFHDTTAKYIRKLAIGSTDDRPVWTDGSIKDGEPDRIFGYPVSINNDMAEIGAGLKFMAFGDFKNYKIRRVAGDRLKVLNELYAENDYIGVVMFKRLDAQLIDAGTHPIKYMINAAS